MKNILSAVFVLWILSIPWNALQAFPESIHIQGKLVENNKVVNGTGPMVFRIYNAPTGGKLLYSESATVQVVDGIYQYQLGQNSTSAAMSAVLQSETDYWLETEIDGTKLAPRQRLHAAPFSLVSYSVPDGAITAAKIDAGAVGTGAIEDGSIKGEDIEPGSISPDLLGEGHADTYETLMTRLKPLGAPHQVPESFLLPMSRTASYTAVGTLITDSGTGNVRGFTGYEAVNELFTYCLEVEFSSALSIGTLLGTDAQFNSTSAGSPVAIHGMIDSVGLTSLDGGVYTYVIRLVPELSKLTFRKNSRVFPETDVQDALDTVATDSGVSLLFSLNASPITNPLLTQYNETNYEFLVRSLYREGFYFIFEHGASSATVNVIDSVSAFGTGVSTSFLGDQTEQPVGTQYIRRIQKGQRIDSGSVIVRSRNGQVNTTPFEATANPIGSIGLFYSYEGRHLDQSAAQTAANHHKERLDSERSVITGTSSVPGLRPGTTITVTDPSGANLGGTYHVLSVRQSATVQFDGEDYIRRYGNVFTAIPDKVKYRPPAPKNPKRMKGLYSATVVGETEGEVDVDNSGRVKIVFPWDRDGTQVLVPVQQIGMQGSMIFPPVGSEVSVAFIEGDPDRPLVIGRVFNADQIPPLALPSNEDTSLVGDGANTIRMESTPNSELLSITGAKDVQVAAPEFQVLSNNVDIGQEVEVKGNLGSVNAPTVGARYRDNGITAWARVTASAGLGTHHFGVNAVVNNSVGEYTITLDTTAVTAGTLVPMAVAEIDNKPGVASAMRVISVNQDTSTVFQVFIQTGTGSPINNDFTFMVTGR